jgi:E3 ubiquitin-protein ligase MARCH6
MNDYQASNYFTEAWAALIELVKPSQASQNVSDTAVSSSSGWLDVLYDKAWEFVEFHFAPIGHEVRTNAARAAELWVKLATGSGTVERVFAVFFGYVVVAMSLSLYLNVLTVGNVRTAGRAVRGAVRQQLLIIKVSRTQDIELGLADQFFIGRSIHHY